MKDLDFNALSHEIWATAQLLPDEGIEDGVSRIKNLLFANFKQPLNKVVEDGQAKPCICHNAKQYPGMCCKQCVHYPPAG